MLGQRAITALWVLIGLLPGFVFLAGLGAGFWVFLLKLLGAPA